MKFRLLLSLITAVTIAGCAGLTQMQDSITKFDQGVHSASAAQMNFFRAVQVADCTNQFYTQTYNWAIHKNNNFDLSGICKPEILSDDQIKIRQALMDAITLYADKMAMLATSDDNKTLDSNSQNIASTLDSVAKAHGFTNLSVTTGVEAAIIAIANMKIDQMRITQIKKSAADMQQYLESIVASLKAENTNFAVGVASKIDAIELELRPIVAETYQQRGKMSFFDVVEARHIMQSVNPFSITPITDTKGAADPKSDAHNVALQLNAMLDAVINANKAIANAGTGGIIAAANDLIARAQAAQSIQAALNK
jgi:hypothetical protein